MAWLTRLENDSRYADPHLHVHAEVFNATYDPSDPKRPFKALDMRPFLSGQLLLSRHFDHELSRAIHALGYTIQKTATSSFEIDGVSEALIARFSKGRTAVKAIEDANGHGAPNRPSIRAILRQARKSRPKKTLRTQHWLRDHWLTQVSLAEFRQLRSLIAASAKQLEASATLREARELLEPVNPSCRRQGPNPVASHQGTDLRNTGSFNFN